MGEAVLRYGWSVVPALACLLPTAGAVVSVTWWEAETDVVGHLAWNGGQGSIHWGNDSFATDSLGRQASAVENLGYSLRPTVEGYANQRLPDYPRPQVFQSQPLPTGVYLNVTRPILLTVYVQKPSDGSVPCGESSYTSEPRFHVELKAGSRWLGGAYSGDRINWRMTPHGTRPSDPAGFAACRFSMMPEADMLPAGTVLTLTFVHILQSKDYPFAFGGEHDSALRIPVYDSTDLLFRRPEVFQVDDAGEAGPSPAMAAAWALAVLTLCPRRRPVAVVALLAGAAILAGCAGRAAPVEPTESAAPSGRIESTFVRDPGTVEPGRGSLLGLVSDDQRLPLPGVHVSLLGSPRFDQTDGRGRFRITAVAEGDYALRFTAVGFRPYEAPVRVTAGLVNRVEVVLYPTDPAARDAQPHVHNYWIGLGPRKIVFDQDVAPYCPAFCYSEGSFRLAPKPGDPNTILPGTAFLELNLTWNVQETRASRLTLTVVSNAYAYNQSVYGARGPDQGFRIPVAWESSDVGHQLYSTWTFAFWRPEGDDPNSIGNYANRNDATYHPTPVHVKATLVRGGALPLEPGHRDLWQGLDTLGVLASAMADVPNPTLYPPYVGLYALPTAQYAPSKLVPPGTRWVEVTQTDSRTTDPQFQWQLHVKPADVPPTSTDVKTFRGYKPMGVGTRSGVTTIWRVNVGPNESDPYYAKASGWEFVVSPGPGEENDYYVGTYPSEWVVTAATPAMQTSMKVLAHRDPPAS